MLFYDGECPLCRREVSWLKRRDRSGELQLIDIADPDCDPSKYNLTHEEVSRVLHGIKPDGTVLRGMDAVREAYRIVGLGWLLAPTKLPGLRAIFDTLYGCFARNRVALGRPFRASCSNGKCTVSSPDESPHRHNFTK